MDDKVVYMKKRFLKKKNIQIDYYLPQIDYHHHPIIVPVFRRVFGKNPPVFSKNSTFRIFKD